MKKLLFLLLSLPLIGNSQSGTGFAIHSDGYIATNYHVVEGSENNISVTGINGNFQVNYRANIVKKDEKNDLVVLKIEKNLGNIPYGFKRKLEDVASNIWAYGYPLTNIQGSEIKLTTGIINSQSGIKDDPRWYQHTASIQPGNSGGPLFNKDGDLVGINNATIDYEAVREKYGIAAQNVNYAIKARYLFNLMEDLNLSTSLRSSVRGIESNEQYKKINKFVYLIISNGREDNTSNNMTAEEYYHKALEEASINLYYYTAIRLCSKALEIKSDYLDAISLRAACYHLTLQNTKAIDDLENLANLSPNFIWVHSYSIPYYRISKIYYSRDFFEDSRYYIDKAWSINQHQVIKNFRSKVYQSCKRPDPYTGEHRYIYGWNSPPSKLQKVFNYTIKLFKPTIKYLRFSYSVVNEGWNSEYVRTGNPNKSTYPNYGIYTRGTTYAQYGFQFKQQLWSTKNIKVLSKTDANIGAIYRGGPTLFESSTGIDFMKDEYSCGSGLMWSFGEFTSFYRIGYNNITATFIPSEYGNRLMFGIGIK